MLSNRDLNTLVAAAQYPTGCVFAADVDCPTSLARRLVRHGCLERRPGVMDIYEITEAGIERAAAYMETQS
ncbi:MAG TPA: hypothetical protein DG761_04830 [Gammaproteobacteria bacterium]|nr:hypothetical protein [Gammaproteobacteria bacterium]